MPTPSLEPLISSKRVHVHTTERHEIALPAGATEEQIQYAIAELGLFEADWLAEGETSTITVDRSAADEIKISFVSDESWGGTDLNRLLWPNAVDAKQALTDRGIHSPDFDLDENACVGECDRCLKRTFLVLMDTNAEEAICRECVDRLDLDPNEGTNPHG